MAEGKILPYLDIPFQHASPRVLKAMRRPAAGEKTLERIRRWREIAPDLAHPLDLHRRLSRRDRRRISTSFSPGLPKRSSTASAASASSRSPAPPANALPDPVPAEVKEQRWHRLMQAQQAISTARLRQKVGRRVPVIVDETAGRSAKGRSIWDAPEIDGAVHLQGRLPIRAGEIVTAKIERSDAYDLFGTVA